jgi:hypothetical protein
MRSHGFQSPLKSGWARGHTDIFDDYLLFLARAWNRPTVCSPHGSLYFHIDYVVHYCKVLLDQIFGRMFSQ